VESLIISKGFSDCVVYISDSGINVTVPAEEEGLSSADVARITDVVKSNTDFSTAELTITMVK
jgi:stage III sporulation protein AH